VTFDARDPSEVAAFWGGLLGRDVVTEPDAALLPGDDAQVGLRFVAATAEKSGPDRMHLHLTSDTPEGQERTVETALRLGGRPLDVGQLPEEGHVVLGDPEGNELCVIEAGNGFLAGCGPLGEVSCDGSRAVGLFWSEVLGWPLVWDENEETAVQSPLGGTKVSWGGPPVAPKQGRNRQRFQLAADDLEAEVARLQSLGATLIGHHDGSVELADPDGNEFSVAVTSR
jgi:catechol 2,3-dioxygenase-like lactoylglutathione lyase family enzyme